MNTEEFKILYDKAYWFRLHEFTLRVFKDSSISLVFGLLASRQEQFSSKDDDFYLSRFNIQRSTGLSSTTVGVAVRCLKATNLIKTCTERKSHKTAEGSISFECKNYFIINMDLLCELFKEDTRNKEYWKNTDKEYIKRCTEIQKIREIISKEKKTPKPNGDTQMTECIITPPSGESHNITPLINRENATQMTECVITPPNDGMRHNLMTECVTYKLEQEDKLKQNSTNVLYETSEQAPSDSCNSLDGVKTINEGELPSATQTKESNYNAPPPEIFSKVPKQLAKTDKKQMELEKIFNEDKDFARIYKKWVDCGFPAHTPGTIVFDDSREAIKQLLNGTFFNDKRVSADFIRKYTCREIMRTIENFKLMFDVDYAPSNKKWLTTRRSISLFIYDVNLNSKSLFLQCLEKPKTMFEVNQERIEKSKGNKEKFAHYHFPYETEPEWFVKAFWDGEAKEELAPKELRGYAWGMQDYERILSYHSDLLIDSPPFAYSDAMNFQKKINDWLDYEQDPEEGGELTFRYNFEEDLNNFVDKYLEMNQDKKDKRITRAWLFSDKVWEMVLGPKVEHIED